MKAKAAAIILFLSLNFSLFSQTNSQSSTLHQVSSFHALIERIYDGDITYEELSKLGDFGIGTFNGLDGEMTAIDGKFYQDSPKGKLNYVKPTQKTPFATVMFFKPTFSTQLKKIKNIRKLTVALMLSLKKKERPHGVKIIGKFPEVSLRNLIKQTPPYKSLKEVEHNPFILKEVEGTLIGYYFPFYLDEVGIGGFHFHFIDKDHKVGGHVIDVNLEEGAAYFQPCDVLQMYFPKSASFSQLHVIPNTIKNRNFKHIKIPDNQRLQIA
ncbi:MAG: acetolactate decarboxylase [Simkania negevensis]|nr:acetolactate decarboxylase [Simkania negevensis]